MWQLQHEIFLRISIFLLRENPVKKLISSPDLLRVIIIKFWEIFQVERIFNAFRLLKRFVAIHMVIRVSTLTAFPMIRNTADVDDRRRFTYDLHAVLWRSSPATLWSVANPPFNQRYIYQPFFENRSPSTTSRDLVTLLDYFLGKRHSLGERFSKSLM